VKACGKKRNNNPVSWRARYRKQEVIQEICIRGLLVTLL